MVTVADILQHIAQALNVVRERLPRKALEGIPAGKHFKMRLCVTTDIEATELEYLKQYGRAYTLYFRIRNQEQAKQLTNDLFDQIGVLYPDANIYSPLEIPLGESLYLFIHIKYTSPIKLRLFGLSSRMQRLQFPFYRA